MHCITQKLKEESSSSGYKFRKDRKNNKILANMTLP